MEKTGIFIDSAYLDKAIQFYSIPPIDIRKLAIKLLGNDQLIKVFYYYCMPYTDSPPTEDQKRRFDSKQRFISVIKKWPGWELRQGRLVKRENGNFLQKRVDVMIALDVWEFCFSNQITTAILVAGDDDFVPVLERAKTCNIKLKLCYSPHSISFDLLNCCSEKIELTRDYLASFIRQGY